MQWNTCESPHFSTGVDNTELSVQIQQGSREQSHDGEREKGSKEQMSLLRECWMAHKDLTGSLQSTLLVHAEMKEIFLSRKQQQHHWL